MDLQQGDNMWLALADLQQSWFRHQVATGVMR